MDKIILVIIVGVFLISSCKKEAEVVFNEFNPIDSTRGNQTIKVAELTDYIIINKGVIIGPYTVEEKFDLRIFYTTSLENLPDSSRVEKIMISGLSNNKDLNQYIIKDLSRGNFTLRLGVRFDDNSVYYQKEIYKISVK